MYLQATEEIFKIITNRNLRYGPIPKEENSKLIKDNLENSIKKGEPIKILIGWGAQKNKNLLYSKSDMAEVLTIKNLKSHFDNINNFYDKGYEITIQHLDTRMADMNGFRKEDTEAYKQSLKENLLKEGLSENVKIVSDSDLIAKNQVSWDNKFKEVNDRVSVDELRKAPAYDLHMKNAEHNNSSSSKQNEIEESLRKMVVYKVTEIETGILKDVPYDFRVFFKSGTIKEGGAKEADIYKHFTKNPYKQSFNAGATINAYTSKKGNAKQPWMAHAVSIDNSGEVGLLKALSDIKENEKIEFFTQSDLKERGIVTKCELCKNCTCGKKKAFNAAVFYESGKENQERRINKTEENKNYLAIVKISSERGFFNFNQEGK